MPLLATRGAQCLAALALDLEPYIVVVCANVQHNLTIGRRTMKKSAIADDIGLADLASVFFFRFLVQPRPIGKVKQREYGVVFNVCIALVARAKQFGGAFVNLNASVLGVTLFAKIHATNAIHQMLTLHLAQADRALCVILTTCRLHLALTCLMDVGIGEKLRWAIVELFQEAILVPFEAI